MAKINNINKNKKKLTKNKENVRVLVKYLIYHIIIIYLYFFHISIFSLVLRFKKNSIFLDNIFLV